MKGWFVYILECSDRTFYTGITDDVESRVAVHNSGKGAKYTRGRTPVILKYTESVTGRSGALKREAEIKRMTRSEKRSLWYNLSQEHIKNGGNNEAGMDGK